ncbi:tripartite tricarboxylate transporter substrate binding protein [Variovorax paradoxus]|uniref:Bug family tripartite tricarboxylate transporter substrate binding protein n=1 Tax=Variovorax paradoxus TaxID=34073 RepID=UPI0021ABD991|nr:tripartite tricarboxylate transporter substrate binding protein [Variovorax paradoxus]UVH60627.1 tripartite tricarboxylate transporter substrate binding protein [Variovorax paradoxus]
MKIQNRRPLLTMVMALAFAGTAQVSAADTFPTKPIRIIVTSAPGGSLDVTTRVVAKEMGERLGQPVIIENRVGAGGLVAIRAVKASPADGYTLLASVNTIAVQQAVSREPGYDVAKDFAGIGPMTRSQFLLLTSPNAPDKTLPEWLARAKAKPGTLTYASAGSGSTTHLAAAMFGHRAGVNLQHIPYKGNSAAWPDLIAGRVGLLMEAYGSASSMLRAGQLKALGSSGTTRLDLLPDVPTIAEQGAPGYSFYLWMGLLAPAGTPKDVVQKLSEALVFALSKPELKKRFRDEGSEVMTMSPDEFTRFVRDEATSLTKLVNDLALPRE